MEHMCEVCGGYPFPLGDGLRGFRLCAPCTRKLRRFMWANDEHKLYNIKLAKKEAFVSSCQGLGEYDEQPLEELIIDLSQLEVKLQDTLEVELARMRQEHGPRE